MFNGSGGMSGDSPSFRITMKEYEDMAIEVGDGVGMEINKVDSAGFEAHLTPCYFYYRFRHVQKDDTNIFDYRNL